MRFYQFSANLGPIFIFQVETLKLREHKRVLHFGSEVSNTMRTHQRGQNRVTRGHVGWYYRSNKRRLYLHRKAIYRNQIFRSVSPSSSTLPSIIKLGHWAIGYSTWLLWWWVYGWYPWGEMGDTHKGVVGGRGVSGRLQFTIGVSISFLMIRSGHSRNSNIIAIR